jgi:hypothetical protein
MGLHGLLGIALPLRTLRTEMLLNIIIIICLVTFIIVITWPILYVLFSFLPYFYAFCNFILIYARCIQCKIGL